MTENRNGLVVNTRVPLAIGTAERDAAFRAPDKAGWIVTFVAAYKLTRMRNLATRDA